MFFNKKITCQKCGEKLSKRFFSDNSNEKICVYCKNEEEEQKRIQERMQKSDKNFQYIRKNCRELFVTHSEAYVCQTSVWFDVFKEKPCLVENHVNGPRDSLLFWSYSYISFEELKDLAKNVSKEVYEKYKNLNESNWKEYIEEIEQLNNRRLVLYTGNFRKYGFSNIILKFCPQPFGVKSWWELSWQGVLENQYGSGGIIALTEDFMKNCSAFELYQHFKQRLNTNTEIPPFYDSEQVVAFLKDIQS